MSLPSSFPTGCVDHLSIVLLIACFSKAGIRTSLHWMGLRSFARVTNDVLVGKTLFSSSEHCPVPAVPRLSAHAPSSAHRLQVRRASLEVGAGMHNATYQQVYQQAYQSIRVPPQQLYQASSLYATSGGGGNGGEMGAGSQAAGTDQVGLSRAVNCPPAHVL